MEFWLNYLPISLFRCSPTKKAGHKHLKPICKKKCRAARLDGNLFPAIPALPGLLRGGWMARTIKLYPINWNKDKAFSHTYKIIQRKKIINYYGIEIKCIFVLLDRAGNFSKLRKWAKCGIKPDTVINPPTRGSRHPERRGQVNSSIGGARLLKSVLSVRVRFYLRGF